MSAPSEGADTRTFLAPASRCRAAASRLVKMPVHSRTTSTRWSRQGSLVTSRSASTLIGPRPQSSASPSSWTLPGKRPWTESYLSRWALVAGGARSLIATTVRSVRPCSTIARRTLRPIRPKPLMAMRTLTNLLLHQLDRSEPNVGSEPLADQLDDPLGRDPEVLVELFVRCRGAETGHADDVVLGADIARP